jgi:hypothetical protein
MPINPEESSMTRGQPLYDKNWQRAQQRVLAYLRFLNLPSVNNLELALQALKRARSRLEESPESHPVTEAWRALQAVLLEQASPVAQDLIAPEGKIPPLTRVHGLCGEIKSMPPLNRGSMVPGKLR